MNHLEFTFADAPWEQMLDHIAPGGELDGVQFLALMETESEESLESALAALDEKDILLNVDAMPAFTASGDMVARLQLEKNLVSRNMLPQGLDENDPLRVYLEEIAALPACGTPDALLEDHRSGREAALPQLTNLMLHHVVEQAFSLAGRGMLLQDLLQEGAMGLWQAILSYQTGDFDSHCKRAIRRSMNKALVLQAREFGIGQKMRTAMEDYRSVDERLLTELGRNPTLEEMAQAMHMQAEETARVAQMLETARRMHAAKQEPDPEEEEEAQTQAVEDTAYFQMRQRISELLSNLEEADAQLLTLRYGLENSLPLSAAQTAQRLGITEDEVTARETAALMKLRNER